MGTVVQAMYSLTKYLLKKSTLPVSYCKRASLKNKSSFSFINLFQNGESEVFTFTWDKDLE
jgi:hypothetical protein